MPRRDELSPAQIAAINARREAAGKAVLGDDEEPTEEEVAEAGEAATDEAAEQETYTVKEGDTLGQIAIDNDTTVEALVELNGIEDPDVIAAGQVLKLP